MAGRGTLRRAAIAALAIAGVVGFLLVTSLPATCPLRVIAKVPCPSCGLTRATRLALGGDLGGATRMHPLWFVIVPWLAVVGSVAVVRYVRGDDGALRSIERSPLVTRTGQAIVVLLVVVWIARFFGAFGGPAPV